MDLSLLRALLDNDLFGFIIWLPLGIASCLLVVFLAMRAYDAEHRLGAVVSCSLFLITVAMIFHNDGLRTAIRWQFHRHALKATVLASQAPADGTLQHMEAEATGFAGVANNTWYVVYDPKDNMARFTGEERDMIIPGLPCKVWRVQRLERDWYSVLFYTDEVWDACRVPHS